MKSVSETIVDMVKYKKKNYYGLNPNLVIMSVDIETLLVEELSDMADTTHLNKFLLEGRLYGLEIRVDKRMNSNYIEVFETIE